MGRAWPSLRHQQWPVLLLLAAMLATDVRGATFVPFPGQQWGVPGAVLLIVPALTAPRWPVRSAVAAAAVLVGSSVVLRVAGVELINPLLLAEAGALMVIVVAAVRAAPVRVAAGAVGLLSAAWLACGVLRDPPENLPADLLLGVVLSGAFMIAPAAAAGRYLRRRDAAADRATREAVAAARQRERVGLARELHDVVAHHIGGIVVQAQAAQVVTGPGAARRVLPLIEQAGTDALSALRRMVVVLRAGDTGAGQPIRTTDLTADLHAVTVTPPGSTPVRLTMDLAEPIPPEVATSVLRLVQESVTNARRHAAGAREIVVAVRAGAGTARVCVHDDGRPGAEPARYGGGFGLVGMRERVQLLGGHFTAGRAPDGGWQMTAEVPLRAAAP